MTDNTINTLTKMLRETQLQLADVTARLERLENVARPKHINRPTVRSIKPSPLAHRTVIVGGEIWLSL